MMEEARKQVPGATFVQGNALEVPFPNDSFSRVFTGHFYGHLQPDERDRASANSMAAASGPDDDCTLTEFERRWWALFERAS